MAEKILLIDDSQFVHSLVRAELRVDGYQIITADNGQAGIEQAQAHHPDLILLDVTMPGMSGHEVCEFLTRQPDTANIPIIFLSGVADVNNRVQGLRQGAVDYITKPFAGEELRARVQISLRQKAMLESEARRAMQDGLTGLWNRAYFDKRLAGELALAERHSWPLSCVMIDIDHFKRVNDVHGHGVGDQAIQRVASVIQSCCRQEDIPCRYGGEEFVVLCTATTAQNAGVLAERVRKAVAGIDLVSEKGRVPITCSCGVADRPLGLQVVKAADEALYQAKQDGRNCVRFAGAVTPSTGEMARAA